MLSGLDLIGGMYFLNVSAIDHDSGSGVARRLAQKLSNSVLLRHLDEVGLARAGFSFMENGGFHYVAGMYTCLLPVADGWHTFLIILRELKSGRARASRASLLEPYE